MAAVATLRLDENRLTTTEQPILGGIITKMPDLYRAITFRLIQQRFFYQIRYQVLMHLA